MTVLPWHRDVGYLESDVAAAGSNRPPEAHATRLRDGYGLIAALIALVDVEALTTAGTKLSATLLSIAGSR